MHEMSCHADVRLGDGFLAGSTPANTLDLRGYRAEDVAQVSLSRALSYPPTPLLHPLALPPSHMSSLAR